jgi:hypothetical protein
MANALRFMYFLIACLIKGPRLEFKGTLNSPTIELIMSEKGT